MTEHHPPPLLLHCDDRGEAGIVATVTIDNAARANCVGSALLEAFAAVFADLAAEPRLRCVILTGAGTRSFVGGADLRELASLDRTTAKPFIRRVHYACRAMRDLPVPVIARINGACLGAGLEMAAACDLRIAADHAIFGMPEVKVGLPSVVEAALLPQLVGWGRTRHLVLLGDNIDAATAERWGLVERVVPATGLDAAVEEWVASILQNGPQSMRLQKLLVRRWETMPPEEAIEEGVRAFGQAFETDEPNRMAGATLARIAGRKKES